MTEFLISPLESTVLILNFYSRDIFQSYGDCLLLLLLKYILPELRHASMSIPSFEDTDIGLSDTLR